MKTCLYHFRELQNDVFDYKQEIHEAEEKIEGFKERLRIQSPTDLESLEDDINKFDIFTNTYSVFVQVYKIVFDFISSRHAEATFFNKNTFCELEGISHTLSEAGLKKLRDEVSEELNEKHLEVLKEKSKKLEKYKKKLEKQEKEYQSKIKELDQAKQQLIIDHKQQIKMQKNDFKEELDNKDKIIEQMKNDHK